MALLLPTLKAIPGERPAVAPSHLLHRRHHRQEPVVKLERKKGRIISAFFLYLKKTALLKQITLLTTIAIIFLCGCSNKPEKKPVKYTDYNFGCYLYTTGKMDSAFLVYNRYVANADDTLNKGMAYRYMGEMLLGAGDLSGAEENMAAAIHTLDPENEDHRAEIGYDYNVLGNINLDMLHYDSAISYYNKAIDISRGTNYMLEVMNGKATALQKMKQYSKAITIYDSIFMMKPKDPDLIARVMDNRAYTQWLQDPGYPVLTEFWSALKIRTDSQYHSGLNASYAHLSDYYTKAKPDSALWYATKMLEKARQNESPPDILEAMDKLIRLNKTSDLKGYWYASYKTLTDSFQLSKDTTRSRFAMIRYDFQKSKADNLVLQDENRNQRLWIYGVVFLAILTITGISLGYIKRRNRIKQESENAIQESKLKTSRKVHDVVANGLYRIMNELEHGKTIEKEPLLDKIEVLYERSRDISYEDVSPVNTADHSKQIHNSLMVFNNEQTKLSVVGNDPAFWNRVTTAQKQELQLVLDEIMVNMKKHSQAKNAAISFKQENDRGLITYKDDGVGFPPGSGFGNGLNNTVNRIKSLKGDITFGKNGESGVLISISLPLQSKTT